MNIMHMILSFMLAITLEVMASSKNFHFFHDKDFKLTSLFKSNDVDNGDLKINDFSDELAQTSYEKSGTKYLIPMSRYVGLKLMALPLADEPSKTIVFSVISKRFPQFFKNPTDFRIMFFSSLWIPSLDSYLTVTRVYVPRVFNVLYSTLFTREWREILADEEKSSGKFYGLQFPSIIPIKSFFLEGESSGPEDPRLFLDPEGHPCIIFNMLTKSKNRRMHVFSFSTGNTVELYVSGVKLAKVEKNWTPITIQDKSYFIISQTGPVVVDCDLKTGECIHLMGPIIKKPSLLRGGSPLMIYPFDDEFLFGVGYAHFSDHAYRSVVALYHLPRDQNGSYRIERLKPIFYSSLIDFGSILESLNISENVRIQISMSIADRWGLGRDVDGSPTGFEDSVDVSVNVEDSLNIIVRMTGLSKYLDFVISLYKKGLAPREWGEPNSILREGGPEGFPILSPVSFSLIKKQDAY